MKKDNATEKLLKYPPPPTGTEKTRSFKMTSLYLSVSLHVFAVYCYSVFYCMYAQSVAVFQCMCSQCTVTLCFNACAHTVLLLCVSVHLLAMYCYSVFQCMCSQCSYFVFQWMCSQCTVTLCFSACAHSVLLFYVSLHVFAIYWHSFSL